MELVLNNPKRRVGQKHIEELVEAFAKLGARQFNREIMTYPYAKVPIELRAH